MDRFNESCAVIRKTGSGIYPESIPDDKWPLIDHIDDVIGGITVTAAKKLLRKYGGSAGLNTLTGTVDASRLQPSI